MKPFYLKQSLFLFFIAFALLQLSGCGEETVAGTCADNCIDLSSSSIDEQLSSVSPASSSSQAVQSNSLNIPMGSTAAITVGPGTYSVQYAASCSRTFSLRGPTSTTSCDCVLGNITMTDVETIDWNQFPSQITLNSTCRLYCQ